MVSEIANVLPEAVYCCFTRTTLFTTMLTVTIVVCLLKSMCILSFVLIGCCMSELPAHLCPYCLRLFIVVLQEVHCFPNCLHVFMIRVRGCFHITKFRYSTLSGF